MTSKKNRLFAQRWFILAALFLIVNAWAVYRYAGAPRVVEGESKLLEFSPRNVLTHDHEISWRFETRMVALEQLGQWLDEAPVSITPPVPGRFMWSEVDQLVFAPEKSWPDCRTFTWTLHPGLRDAEGRAIAPLAPVTLATQPLRFETVQQVDLGADHRMTLRLQFSHPPHHASLRERLKITGAGQRAISFSIQGGVESSNVLVQTSPVRDEHITLHLRDGLTTSAGPVGLQEPVSKALNITRHLAVTRIRPRSSSFEQGSVSITFTHPVVVDKLKSFISLKPAVKFDVQNEYTWSRGHQVKLVGDFEPGKQYALTFRAGLQTVRGNPLLREVNRTVYFPDRKASIAFRTPGNYLSTQGSKRILLTTVNAKQVELVARRIYPNNLVQFALRRSDKLNSYYGDDSAYLGHTCGKSTIKPEGVFNQPVETPVDLAGLMGEHASGAFMVKAQLKETGSAAEHLVVVSDIGISVKDAKGGLLVWANSILTNEPVADAELVVYSATNQELYRGRTDALGLARMESDQQPFLVTVQKGEDISYLRLQGTRVNPAGDTGSDHVYARNEYDACLFTGRGICRPGETAHVKAVVRDRELKAPGSFPVELKSILPDGRTHRVFSAMLNENGTAEFDIPFEDYAATGRYRFQLQTPGEKLRTLGSCSISVEAYVPPRIAVSVERNVERANGGDELAFDISGRYLFGAPAAGLPASGWIEYKPVDFKHADWPGYTFRDPEKKFASVQQFKLGAGKLDEHGAGRFTTIVPKTWRPPSAIRAVFGAQVQETSGRSSSAYTSRNIDAYPCYLGLKPRREGGQAQVGVPFELDAATVRPDGTLYEGELALTLRVQQVEWVSVMQEVNGRYRYQSKRKLHELESRELTLDGARGTISFTPERSGQYLLTLADPEHGGSSSLTFHARSADQTWYAWSKESPDRVALELDREVYRPGDTAQLVIKSPFAGRALLTIETDRVLQEQVIEMTANTHEIELPVSEDWTPNVYCTVNVIRPVKPGESGVVHRAAGAIPLTVRKPERRLNLALSVPERIRPKTRLTVGIDVRDLADEAVPAELVVVAVDEGICMLTDFDTPDPLKYFQRKRRLGVEQYDLYSLLMPEIDHVVLGGPSETGGGGGIADALRTRLNPIRAKRFRPVALWQGAVKANAEGFAEAVFDVPEFTGELRIMAVAISGERFGSAQAPVQVKRPLIVQHGLPRFLAPGDSCTVPVHLFNQSKQAMNAEISLDCQGPLGHSHFDPRVPLAAGEESVRHIELQAGDRPGKAVFTLRVNAGPESYEEAIEIAVRPASPGSTISGSGSIKPGETVLVNLPPDFMPGTGQRRLHVAPSPSIELGGSLDYLLRYPYGCLEQTTSSAFPLVYLPDLYEHIRPGELEHGTVESFVQAGIYRVLGMQHGDGGFGYWPGGSGYAWGSVYATHFLVEAKRAGYEVPEDQLKQAMLWLERTLGHTVGDSDQAAWRQGMNKRSYACLVLALADRKPDRWLHRLVEQYDQLDTAAQVNVAAALTASGRRREAGALLKTLSLTAPAYREQGGGLNSSVRDAAVLLSAWLDLDPENGAVPGLVGTLNRAKTVRGTWGTTQENAVALMALGKYSRYLHTAKKEFKGRVQWDGKTMQVDHTRTHSPSLSDHPKGGITLTNEGPGLMFYQWSASGISLKDVPESDQRLTVRRRVLNLDGKPADLAKLEQGQVLMVELELDGRGKHTENLAVEDLLPAGLEVENPRLANSQQVQWKPGLKTLPVRKVEMRDDRVILFTGVFRDKRVFHYPVRAVAAGRFVYPPVMAECMYDPNIRSVHGKREVTIQ